MAEEGQENLLEALVQRSSRQEVSRILQSIDSGLGACEGSSFQAEGLGHWVAQECGYEDIGELEDALGCQFDLFLESLPHVSVTSDDTGTKRAARRRKGQGKSRKFSLTVKDRRDLDRSVLRGPRSRVVLPELEVEFSADGERKVDTIRGAISHAAFELSISAQGAEGERREKIWQASEQVKNLLDVETSWTWEMYDPDGDSAISPEHGIEMREVSQSEGIGSS